jgi:hypothetical protein
VSEVPGTALVGARTHQDPPLPHPWPVAITWAVVFAAVSSFRRRTSSAAPGCIRRTIVPSTCLDRERYQRRSGVKLSLLNLPFLPEGMRDVLPGGAPLALTLNR